MRGHLSAQEGIDCRDLFRDKGEIVGFCHLYLLNHVRFCAFADIPLGIGIQRRIVVFHGYVRIDKQLRSAAIGLRCAAGDLADAPAMAQGKSDEEVALLAAIFTQLGDSLAMIVVLRACEKSGGSEAE